MGKIMTWNDEKPKDTRRVPGGVCSFCGGGGYTDLGKCDLCRGSGRNPKRRK